MEQFRIRFIAASQPEPAIELIRRLTGHSRADAEAIVAGQSVLLEQVHAAEARRVVERFARIHGRVEVERSSRYVYAYAPDHPDRAGQAVTRLRFGALELGLSEGRLGSFDAEKIETYANPGQAAQAAEAQVAAWTREGRRLAARETEVLEALSPRERTLEASLRERPDDLDAHAIYSDWLQAHGDARGQLIAVQLALASASGATAKALAAQDRALRARHLGHLFGPLRRHADLVAERWSLGFIDAAAITDLRFHPSLTGPLEALAVLTKLPIAARVTRLRIGRTLAQHPKMVELLGHSDLGAAIRTLELGDEVELEGASLRAIPELWPHLPKLTRLVLYDNEPPLDWLDSPSLVELELHLRGIWRGWPGRVLAPIATREPPTAGPAQRPSRARLAQLHRIVVVIDEPQQYANFEATLLAELLARPELADAPELVLRAHDRLSTELAAVVLASPALARRERVDLSACRADNGVLRTLARAQQHGTLPPDTAMPAPIV